MAFKKLSLNFGKYIENKSKKLLKLMKNHVLKYKKQKNIKKKLNKIKLKNKKSNKKKYL